MCGISFSVYIVTPTYLQRVQQDQGFVVVSGVNSDFTRTFMVNVRSCYNVTVKCTPPKRILYARHYLVLKTCHRLFS